MQKKIIQLLREYGLVTSRDERFLCTLLRYLNFKSIFWCVEGNYFGLNSKKNTMVMHEKR